VHDEAPAASETDWPQILALYEVPSQVAPGPVVTLSRAVALAMVHGPEGRARPARRTRRGRPDDAHAPPRRGRTCLSEQRHGAARESYLRAARMTASAPEQRYPRANAPARLRQPGPPGDPAGLTPADMPARSPQIRLACRPGRLSLSVPGHTVGM